MARTLSRSAFRWALSRTLPPKAKTVPHVFVLHGKEIRDDYHWMRSSEDKNFLDHAEFLDHVKEENR